MNPEHTISEAIQAVDKIRQTIPAIVAAGDMDLAATLEGLCDAADFDIEQDIDQQWAELDALLYSNPWDVKWA